MKRLFDISLSLVLIILFLPVYLIVSTVIVFKMGRPILFKQKRPGLNEKIFKIYKFRTMTSEKNKNGVLLPDDKRLLGIGKFIRSVSLDELPQLFNVLKGEMSFVGPRPLLIEYLDLYDTNQKNRHNVKPGITGWAQVNGRNAISWEKKFEYDLWYINNQSFILDLKILWMTFLKVVRKSDITSASAVSMEKFEGSMPTLFIYGASGHGLVVQDIAKACNYKKIVFIDDGDNEFKTFESIKNKQELTFALGIGNNKIRKVLYNKIINSGFKIISLIHPSAVISDSCILGKGSVVMPNVVINSNSKIGNGVILNTSSIVEHENKIGDFVHISPNVSLSGCVTIKDITHIGIGSSIIQGVTIGSNCMIGAGSVVIKDIDNNNLAYGNPCKNIREMNE